MFLFGQLEPGFKDGSGEVLAILQDVYVCMQIDNAVAKVKMHDILLQCGFIGLLKAFLEPLPTQKIGPTGQRVPTLPHAQVRATIYRSLQRLPINTLEASSRDMLKSSGIGPVLRFYSKVRDESPANRRLVTDLLNAWMAPIVEEGRKAVLNTEQEEQRREVCCAGALVWACTRMLCQVLLLACVPACQLWLLLWCSRLLDMLQHQDAIAATCYKFGTHRYIASVLLFYDMHQYRRRTCISSSEEGSLRRISNLGRQKGWPPCKRARRSAMLATGIMPGCRAQCGLTTSRPRKPRIPCAP